MGPLKKRLILSAILISVSLYAMFWAPYWIFFAVIWVFAFLGLNEFVEMAKMKGLGINRILVLSIGVVLPFALHFSLDAAALALSCLVVCVFYFRPQKTENALTNTAVSVFGLLYVTWFFSHLLKIKLLPDGSLWILYVILIVKGGDAGAYFVGKSIGKTKLIQHISPNKSVEGAVGGLLTSVALSVASKTYLQDAPIFHLFLLGTLIGILSQIGDLSESLLKRDAGVKDSGHIPGLGGILDVLDSLLLTIPFVFYYIAWVF